MTSSVSDTTSYSFSRNQLCFCGSGQKLKHCHKTAEPDSRAAHLYHLYQDIDHTIDDYRATSVQQPPCSAGCRACCSDYVPISQVEFELLLIYMERNWSTSDIEDAFAKAAKDWETFRVENPPMYASLAHPTNTDDELNAIRHHATRNSFACPLLDAEKGTCRVYPVRPFICRTHGSSHTFYGTWKERLRPEKICEYIPGGKPHRKITPNIADRWSDYERIADVMIGPKRRPLRQYPIMYWLVLYAKHGGGATTAIGNLDNFELSLQDHNNKMAQYTGK